MKMEELIELVEIQLGKKEVRPSDHFISDLNAESLDKVHLAAAIEDRFGIIIPEDVLVSIQTVKDLFDYLSSLTAK